MNALQKTVGWLALSVVAACNIAPEGGVVGIEPENPMTGDDLVAVLLTEPDDRQTFTLAYAWSVDGSPSTDHTTDTVPASATTRGETWSVAVTATDEKGASAVFEASTEVVNTPPVVDTVAFTPTTFDATATLTASATGSDDDGDALTWSYTWYVGTKAVQSGKDDTLTGAFVGGDEVRVEAVANDGFDDSEASTSSSATVTNTAPTITGAHIEPTAPTSSDTLSCAADGAVDIDGDTITYTTTWSVNGKPAGTSETLDPKMFARDAVVACATTPTDGEDTGAGAIAKAVTIGNSPPVVATLEITPDPFTTGDPLTAVPTTFDQDGDPVTLTYSWTVDTKEESATDTLAAFVHTRDAVVELTVTPNDGFDDGAPSVVSKITQNAPPTGPDTWLSCGDLERDLVCHAPSTDDDGDKLTVTFSWTLDGKTWNGKPTTTLVPGDTVPNSALKSGQTWACTATVTDGIDTTDPVDDSEVIGTWDGEVMLTDGSWTCADYEICGTGATCTAADAKAACTDVGLRVASHASDGTKEVADLGATSSCYWSASYYTTKLDMAATECLVGISNLEWSDCCGTTRWHGNTLAFGKPDAVFGYVSSNTTGYVPDYPNVSGATWGCVPEESAASANGCSTLYVACTE